MTTTNEQLEAQWAAAANLVREAVARVGGPARTKDVMEGSPWSYSMTCALLEGAMRRGLLVRDRSRGPRYGFYWSPAALAPRQPDTTEDRDT